MDYRGPQNVSNATDITPSNTTHDDEYKVANAEKRDRAPPISVMRTAMPSSLNCPTCGAPAPGAVAERCDYCGSTLTSIGCPACFSPMFAGMEFCPQCGAKAAREDGDAVLPCPGCQSNMRAIRVGDTALFECAECGSTWLESDTFTALCADREAHGAIADLLGPKTVAVTPTTTRAVRYVSCPSCAKIMNRENFGHRSGVIVDVCKGHGVWLERGELHSVLAFVDGGGLERARRLDDDRCAEERRALDDALRRLLT
jgi:Zn-finger nucleic acid-binding protein